MVTWQYCVRSLSPGVSCNRGLGGLDVEKPTGDEGGVAHSRANAFIIILNKILHGDRRAITVRRHGDKPDVLIYSQKLRK